MKAALLLLVATAVAFGAYFVWGSSSPTAVSAVQPLRENLVSRLSTNGRVEPIEDFTVHAETTGIIPMDSAKHGDAVRRGPVLFVIDDEQARAGQSQAAAQREIAGAELAAARRGGSPGAIAEQESLLEQAKTGRKQAEDEVAALERLVGKNAAPRAELDVARARLAGADSEIERLTQKLELRVAPDDVERAEARLREAEATVALANRRAGSAAVRSPAHGALYSLVVEPGAYVNSGALVARVGNLERVRIRIYVDEPELGRVEMGDRVSVTSDGFPGREWECAIDRLAASVISLETRRVLRWLTATTVPNCFVTSWISRAFIGVLDPGRH
jgi:HlyD family secretion protein